MPASDEPNPGAAASADFGLALYRSAFRQPHVVRLVVGGLIGRLREGGIGLGIILCVRHATGSFTIAGGAAAVFIAGAAIGRPLQGRLGRRLGARNVLVASSLSHAGAVIVLAVWASSQRAAPTLLTMAAICGVLLPAISAFLRASWPIALPHARPTAFAIDAVTYDVSNIAGPALVASIAGLASPSFALVALTACGLAGTFVAVGAPSPRRLDPTGEEVPHRTALRGAVLAVAAVTSLVAFAEGCVTVAVPAVGALHHATTASGYLLSAFAIGSLVGGLFYGVRRWASRAAFRLVACVLIYAVGLLAIALTTHNLVLMGVVILAAGLARAPIIATMSFLMDAASPREVVVEAFAWMSVAGAIGAAAGQACAGVLVTLDVRWPYVAAAAGAAASAVVARCYLWGETSKVTRIATRPAR